MTRPGGGVDAPEQDGTNPAGAPGSLRTYLGTAPGVGKTYAMLSDGHREAQHGRHVVIGWFERHGRRRTAEQLRGLELIAPKRVNYRGHGFTELDVHAVIRSNADLVLVDELAHTYPDGTRTRWQDVADLLAAGMEVWTTTNVANLTAVRDHAARLTGAGSVESVPDDFVRSGEVVVVDLPAAALRQRIVAGEVYSAQQVGGALAHYFRTENLEALSELAHAWVTGDVDRRAAAILARHGVEPETCPLIVAGLVGLRDAERVIRRAAVLAREADGDLLVVVADEPDGSVRRQTTLRRLQALTAELGGRFVERAAPSALNAVADVARTKGATTVVVADRRRSLGPLTRRSPATKLGRLLPGVSIEEAGAEGTANRSQAGPQRPPERAGEPRPARPV